MFTIHLQRWHWTDKLFKLLMLPFQTGTAAEYNLLCLMLLVSMLVNAYFVGLMSTCRKQTIFYPSSWLMIYLSRWEWKRALADTVNLNKNHLCIPENDGRQVCLATLEQVKIKDLVNATFIRNDNIFQRRNSTRMWEDHSLNKWLPYHHRIVYFI